MQYKENDILVDKYGDERKVLGVCGQVCFLSRTDDFDLINGTYTQKELDELGYHLKSNAPTITIEGKTYDKKAVEERLKELPEVE